MSSLPLSEGQKTVDCCNKLVIKKRRGKTVCELLSATFCFLVMLNGGVEAAQVVATLNVAEPKKVSAAQGELRSGRSFSLHQQTNPYVVGDFVVLAPLLKPEGVPLIETGRDNNNRDRRNCGDDSDAQILGNGAKVNHGKGFPLGAVISAAIGSIIGALIGLWLVRRFPGR